MAQSLIPPGTFCRRRMSRRCSMPPDSGAKPRPLPAEPMTFPSCRSGFTRSHLNTRASRPLTFVDVEQVIGRTRTLSATLQVSGGQQRVEVSSSSEQFDNTSAAIGTCISDEQAKATAAQRPQLGQSDRAFSPPRSIPAAAASARFDSPVEAATTTTSPTTASTPPISSTSPSRLMFASPFPSTPLTSFASTPCSPPPKLGQREARNWL